MGLPANITTDSTLPAHLQGATSLGNENVTAEDIQIPRLKLLQKMSPEVDEGAEKYIEDAKAGQLLNSVTNEVHDEMYVLNLFFESGYVVFRKREEGGGLFGRFESEAEAKQQLTAAGEEINHFDIALTHTHTLLLLDSDGKIEMPALMDFASSKLKVSRAWNSDIQLRCGGAAPRFGAVYKLKGKLDRNSKGQTWHNVETDFMGWADADLAKEAEETYYRMKESKGMQVEEAAA